LQDLRMDPNTSSQDVIRCDLCETAVVQMHCDTCLVNLCKACVGEHISDESKDHKVVKFQSRNTPLSTLDAHTMKQNDARCTVDIVTFLSASLAWILIYTAVISYQESNNNIIELYDTKRHLHTKIIRTKSGSIPADITVTCSGDIIYTDDVYKTVNIVKDDKIQEMIRFKNWKPRKICSTSSAYLLVTMESDDNEQSKVVRYSGSTEKQTIQFDDKGDPLYTHGSHKYICENRNFDICVAECRSNTIVVVNQGGKLRFKYFGHSPAPKNELFRPRGITTDSQCHILTTDHDNNCIHIMDQDGQFLNYIDCGMNNPYGICIDPVGNLLALCIDRIDDGYYTGCCVLKIKY
ncbi:uncharacterized protein LOC134244494, partial [Saccostrea cucullata]|uniref:uncharacterized protein LOC134244494 n=1 Tax=Saccostrea cuccullata TaxID=36930 RepID=UPI002ED3C9DD